MTDVKVPKVGAMGMVCRNFSLEGVVNQAQYLQPE